MRNDYIHLTLVIDKSGSMYSSKEDVVGGISKLIDEQKANKDGKVTVSMYTFNDKVDETFVGKDVNDIGTFEYSPDGLTALNDGVGIGIDNTGKWLAAMDESERPGKVLFAVFTDGMENASKEYTSSRIREMIKHQEEKYNWTFLYLGADITTTKGAKDLGIKLRSFTSKLKMGKNYDMVREATTLYRKSVSNGETASATSSALNAYLLNTSFLNTHEYENDISKNIEGD